MVLARDPRPGTNFLPFIKLIMTLFAVVAEIPYALISGNYEDLNYSTSKLRNGQARHIIFSAHDRSSRKITRGTH